MGMDVSAATFIYDQKPPKPRIPPPAVPVKTTTAPVNALTHHLPFPVITDNDTTAFPMIRPCKGRLWLRVCEARDIRSPSGLASRLYCVVQVEKNEFVTKEGVLSAVPPPWGGTPLFCSATWKHEAIFDLSTQQGEMVITVWDRSAPLGREVFLGMVRVTQGISRDRQMSDVWYRLMPRTAEEVVQGEIRLQYLYKQAQTEALSPRDFELLKLVGKGSFGRVLQVRKTDTGRIYAMKILTKKDIVARQEVAHTISERNVLAQAHSPFLVSLKFSFQTPGKLYFVLDYLNGGELFYHLQKDQMFDESRAKFYAAELVLALEHLHNLGIVYRDLKPENVLLDSLGHIALTDFGLCKENITYDRTTKTFCGTAEYLAPEVLTGQGYGQAVDWWSLGVLLFEMIAGLPPFYSEDTNEMYRKILNDTVAFPSRFSEGAKAIVSELLVRDPKRRLGGVHDAKDLRRHAYFADVNWARLYRKEYQPPFKPRVESEMDTSNFDPSFTTNLPIDSVPDSPISDSLQRNFQGFTYSDDGSLRFPPSTSAGLNGSGSSLKAVVD